MMIRKTRRQRRRLRGITEDHVVALVHGQCLSEPFGEGPEADQAMAKAWQDPEVRERVYASYNEESPEWRAHYTEPWAEKAFGTAETAQ